MVGINFVSVGVSQILELMRQQIDAVTGAQIQALSRQSPVGTHAHPSPRLAPEITHHSFGLPVSRLDSSRSSDSSVQYDTRSAEDLRSDDWAQTDPIIAGTMTPQKTVSAASPEASSPVGNDMCDNVTSEASAERRVQVTCPPKPLTPAGQYLPLSHVKETMTRINVYVVAVEMIRASVRNLITQRDLLNYRAIDPSIHGTTEGDDIDYSVQILAPNCTNQFHVNYGDIIRLKRVDTKLVVDKSGNRHINIIMSLKNHPSMRVWPNSECRVRTDEPEKGDEGTAGEDQTHQQSQPDPLQQLESEALLIYGGNRTRVDNEDLEIISRLREWVRTKLDAAELTGNRNFLHTIAGASEAASDFVVCVLEVTPEPEVNLVVSDSTSMAVVMGMNDILVSNLLESNNRIQPGEWIKLRYVQRLPQQFKRANGSSYVVLKASTFSCATRLPRCCLPYVKPIPVTSSRYVYCYY
ncbi:uncharacterized protein BXIN_2192 [Babesia sp. Xinjiang]|uniref:uncharacterized protein n=1 Tax=Babesia sp. Xinjiang TaxID=462227 RepID=UPI000A215053|nr:uncharacterized protein BXIN_2192 [Babesia sp. Xinjiang]ORM40349.1 hypothetical protein BXIN_2192 [Babesia sp. Xinjiang]